MAAGRIRLEGVGATIQGLSWESSEFLRIGRDQHVDIVFSDPSVGAFHAEIRMTHRGWTVHDLGSSSGTLVNGIRVDASGRKLQKNDLIQVGRLALRVNDLEIERLAPSAILAPPKDIRATGSLLHIQAFSQLSWEKGLEQSPGDNTSPAPAKHFLMLLRAGYYLSRLDSVSDLLQSLLDDTVAVLDAQRGAIALTDESTGIFSLKSVSGPKSVGASRHFSKTLAERCFAKGESLLCVEACLPGSVSVVRGDMASVICGLLRSPRRRLGVLHVDRGPLQKPFSENDLRFVDEIAATVSVGIESAIAIEKERTEFLQGVASMALRAIAVRDPATADHCRRVSVYAGQLAQKIGLSLEESHILHMGALLHDLGNIGIDDAVLKKQGPLTSAEAESLRTHVPKGVSIAEGLSGLAPLIPIIRHHHEYWDGTGYPDGLKGEGIPRLARLVTVVDALDDMMTSTVCRAGLSFEQACKELQGEAGRKFDPTAVAAALQIQPPLAKQTPSHVQHAHVR